jgi:ribosomal protein S13
MNLYKEIQNIKSERDIFINSFNPLNLTEEDVINTCENINLQSIRVHKYLTSTGDIGKVATAKFLSSINLDENSRFTDIDKKQIKLIIEYINT